MDDADRAGQDDERLLAASVKAIRERKADALYTNQCLFCGAFTDKLRRWCDSTCRDGWERER